MLSFLKDHPFAVEAFFESVLVLAFSVPKEEVAPLIPECLEPDTFQGGWAFVAVALVQTRDLRPRGFPRILGHDFFLTGYRVFVRYTGRDGKTRRGLYILKSETDKNVMEYLGNVFTRYRYTTTDITRTCEQQQVLIKSVRSGFEVKIETGSADVPLPPFSPFRNWGEARKFAGPLPYTFSYDSDKGNVLIVEGVRQYWQPKPVNVVSHEFSFLQSLGLGRPPLANAFMMNHIPYYWKKGKQEKWKQ